MGLALFFERWLEEGKAQKDRLFLWLPVVFGLGIAAYFAIPFEPNVLMSAAPPMLLLAVLVRLYPQHHDSAYLFARYLVCLAMFLLFCGIGAAKAGTHFYGTPILQKSMTYADVQGVIESIEKLDGKRGSRVVLNNLVIEELPPHQTPRKIRITFRKDENLKAGARIKTLAKLDAPSNAVLPGAYDFRRHLFFEGIGAVGFSYRSAVIITQSQAAPMFEAMRESIHDDIKKAAGPVSAGIISALITGERGEIAEEDNEAMRDSGLYHLLSISGGHVATVAGVLFFFLRFFMAAIPWIALRFPIKKIAACAAMIGATFYVLLAGAEVPAIRALLMTGLVMLAIMLDRSPLSTRLVAFSAMVILIMVPHALVGVSFQMSFAAVAALICFFEYIRPWWMAWYSSGGFVRKAFMYVVAVLITSVIAGGMTGFFSLYHFQSFAVFGVLANMMAVPLTAFVIMPAAIVAMILTPFGLTAWAYEVMEWGVLKMLVIAHWTAGFEGAVFHVTQWPIATFVLGASAIVLFLVWGGWRGKAAAVFLMMVGLFVASVSKPPDVMVSSSGKLQAVRSGDDVFVSSIRKEKFVVENWMRLQGLGNQKPKSFYSDASPVACDDFACRWEQKGKKISFLKGRDAMNEECAWADMVISPIPVSKKLCGHEAKLIDLYDVKDRGAHAIYLNDVRIKSVGEAVGARPWR